MATRNLSIRLSVEDADTVRRALEGLGEDGQRALKRLDSASREASRGTLALNDAMGEVRGTMQGYANQLGPLGAGLTALGPAGLAAAAGIGAAALGITAAVRQAREAMAAFDDLANTADKLGVSTSALQELRYAAEQAGISTDTFDMALQRFTRRAAEAAQGTGEAKDALAQLGITLTDASGNLRPAEDLLGDVADALVKIESPAERVRLAFKLFDSEGVAMVNMLGQGSKAMENMREQARALGLVVSDDVVRNAAKMNDKFDTAVKIIDTQLKTSFVELAPIILSVAQAVAGLVQQLANMLAKFQEVENITPKALDAEAKRLRADIAALSREGAFSADDLSASTLAGVGFGDRPGGNVLNLATPGGRERLMEQLQMRLAEIEAQQRSLASEPLRIEINKPAPVDTGVGQPTPSPVAKPGASDAAKRAADEEARANDKVAESVMRLLEARRRLDEGIDEMIGSMQRERAELTMSDQERSVSEQVLRAEALARQQGVEITNAQREAVRAEAEETFKATEAHRQLTEMRTRGQALHERLMTPEEQQAGAAAELAELYGQGAISEEDFRRGLADLREQTTQTTSAADELGLTFSSAFEDAIVGGKEFSEVLKGLEQDLLRIATRTLITEPLANATKGLFNDLLGGGAPQQSMAWRNPDTGQVLNTGGGGAGGGLLSGLFASIFHGGGVVGGPAPVRAVSPDVFRDAPRLHSGGAIGLRGDEVPAILQRGEVVLPRGGAAAAPVNINIVNNSGAQVDVRQSNGGRQIDVVIDEMIAGAIRSGGRTTQALRQMGVRPNTVAR